MVSLGITCLFVVLVTCGCINNDTTPQIIMTFEEFVNDYNESVNNDSKIILYWFDSLDEGDSLLIKDMVNDVTYNQSLNYSRVEFASLLGNSFPVQGDISTIYHKEDTIEIKLHIINATFTDINPYTGEIWTFEIETFQEGWDHSTNDYVPVPATSIRRVSA